MKHAGLGRLLVVAAGCVFLATGDLASQEASFSIVTLDNPTPQAQAGFGRTVAAVGDVNGDSVPDLLVGANLQDVGGNIRQGQVFVFSGADTSLLLTLDNPNPQAGAFFGFATAGVGDVDADGVPDLLVGAFGQDVGGNANQGQVYVFSGADGSLVHTLDDPTSQVFANFGSAVAGVGDVDADGVPDLLVGAVGKNVGGNNFQGQAFVFSGASGSLVRTLDNPNAQANAFFGVAVAGVGDVDNDGVLDLLVGAHLQDVGVNINQGQAHVFSGTDGTLLATLDNPNPQAESRFGLAVAGPGDVNADGVPDLLVGAEQQDVGGNSDQGQAFVFSGVDTSLLLTLDNPNPQAGAFFGRAVAAAGDVNADGAADLLVGAFGQDVGGNFRQGQAFVLSGADADLLATLDNPNPQAESRFGLAVAGPGDVNADGVPDLLVGARRQDVGATIGQGQVFLFLSTPTPSEAIQQLIADVLDLNLQRGIESSLDGKLDAVTKALNDLNENNDAAACNALQAFINAVEAQSGNQIPQADADALIAAAQSITDALGCP